MAALLKLESMSVDDVASWLDSQGFPLEVMDSFKEQDMDGEAIMAMFAAAPGPDCLKDVLKKLGQRLKVYKAIKGLVEADAEQEFLESDGTRSPSQASTLELSQVSSRPPIDQSSTSSKSPSLISSGNNSRPSPGFDHHRSPPSGSGNGVPNPFPIPRFRKLTQEKLDENHVSEGDRKYMVSMLGTVLLTYVERASKKDCHIVAESLVRKYPFLKESHSWQQFIYNKCQNINRRPSGSGATSSKRPKLATKNSNAHSYPGLEDGEDEESYKRNLILLEKELLNNHPSLENLKDLMKRTFSERRRWIVGTAVSAKEIWTKFPLLKKPNFISRDFFCIIKQSGCCADFVSDLLRWQTAINEYSLSTSNPSAGLREALKDYPLEVSDDEEPVGNPHEWELLTAVRCLGYYLIAKKKGPGSATAPEYDIPYILRIFQSGTPPADCLDTGNNLPYIVKMCYPDYERAPQYFIAFEQELIIECQKLCDSIFILLAVHYVFNVVYHSRVKNFFLFLEEKVLALPSIQKGSKNAAYCSVVAGIESFLQE